VGLDLDRTSLDDFSHSIAERSQQDSRLGDSFPSPSSFKHAKGKKGKKGAKAGQASIASQ